MLDFHQLPARRHESVTHSQFLNVSRWPHTQLGSHELHCTRSRQGQAHFAAHLLARLGIGHDLPQCLRSKVPFLDLGNPFIVVSVRRIKMIFHFPVDLLVSPPQGELCLAWQLFRATFRARVRVELGLFLDPLTRCPPRVDQFRRTHPRHNPSVCVDVEIVLQHCAQRGLIARDPCEGLVVGDSKMTQHAHHVRVNPLLLQDVPQLGIQCCHPLLALFLVHRNCCHCG